MAEKHPQIDRATEEQLSKLLQGRRNEVREAYLEAHRLILETLPDVNYTTDITDGMTSYGVRQYGYNGWGMAALAPHTNWVSLHFMRGTSLDNPEGILEGSGKRMRHVKLRSSEHLAPIRAVLKSIILQAASLHGKDTR